MCVYFVCFFVGVFVSFCQFTWYIFIMCVLVHAYMCVYGFSMYRTSFTQQLSFRWLVCIVVLAPLLFVRLVIVFGVNFPWGPFLVNRSCSLWMWGPPISPPHVVDQKPLYWCGDAYADLIVERGILPCEGTTLGTSIAGTLSPNARNLCCQRYVHMHATSYKRTGSHSQNLALILSPPGWRMARPGDLL